MRFLTLLLTLLLFLGCSSKTPDTAAVQNSIVADASEAETQESDDFDDEFEDEFAQEEVFDPLSGYNRFMTTFNDTFYVYVLDPVARGYRYILHKEIRSSIGNFFHNLLYPVRLVNNVLQLKFKNAVEETGRFLVNSTVGILGLFDPAKSYLEWEKHDEDFGQTLGHYGVGGGFHIVLPFLGPSNLRDTFGLFPDAELSPLYDNGRSYSIAHNDLESLGYIGFERLNFVSLHIGEYEELKKDAVDLYPFLRNIYEQYREKLIKE